jgi:hypothetical protein
VRGETIILIILYFYWYLFLGHTKTLSMLMSHQHGVLISPFGKSDID